MAASQIALKDCSQEVRKEQGIFPEKKKMCSEHSKIIAIHTQETRCHKLTFSALLCMRRCKSLGLLKLFLWDGFELCWRKLLTVPWTARRSNQSILKEIITEYSLEGLMLKLKL